MIQLAKMATTRCHCLNDVSGWYTINARPIRVGSWFIDKAKGELSQLTRIHLEQI